MGAAAACSHFQSMIVQQHLPRSFVCTSPPAVGLSTFEEWLAVPCRVNSGSVGTMANWAAIFAFVDYVTAEGGNHVDVDEVRPVIVRHACVTLPPCPLPPCCNRGFFTAVPVHMSDCCCFAWPAS